MSFDMNTVVGRLSEVKGVASIALGGSHSRNEATATSDYDIGLYYTGHEIDLPGLHEAISALDDNGRQNLLNEPGAWGPWINGGSWITVAGTPVDILLRDISQVKKVIADCLDGNITIDYQCGHPFGFVNSIYAAETHYCIPLWESAGSPLTELKAMLRAQGAYPLKMKSAIIRKFLWEAEFSLDCGYKPALRGDFNYAAGSVFRTVCSWLEVLYAVNETYLMNEKGALKQLDKLKIKPQNMESRTKAAYQSILSDDPHHGSETLKIIHNEIRALSDMRR